MMSRESEPIIMHNKLSHTEITLFLGERERMGEREILTEILTAFQVISPLFNPSSIRCLMMNHQDLEMSVCLYL